MKEGSRYIIGIDLGTTNSCVAYVDTDLESNPALQVRTFPIPQLTSEGRVEPAKTLPSFCYLAREGEFPPEALRLPWPQHTALKPVGALARDQGGKVPTQLVQSAKSWLCNSAAEREEKILPLMAGSAELRMSPVEASALYLSHIRQAWNLQMGKSDPSLEMEQQEVVLTVPASFDEVARGLTVEAAKRAGLGKLTLLEEPQAAFYSWIAENSGRMESLLKEGELVLVCDVGGGTTDFSLIEVAKSGELLSFQRSAVGRHLLLGGDNMDAAIAALLEEKQRAKGITDDDSVRWAQLLFHARQAKEELLGQKGKLHYQAQMIGRGASVVKSSRQIEISQEELLNSLMKGFFEVCDFEQALHIKRGSALRSMGLPYEEEPSIIKQLAGFLNSAKIPHKGHWPDYILFNGGAMKPQHFQEAVMAALERWSGGKRPALLATGSLDLAVSRGASYFGRVKRGMGVRIGGGSARGLYLALEVKGAEGGRTQALTLLPRGSEEGTLFQPDRIFSVRSNRPVNFQLFSSHIRLDDRKGDLVPIEEEEMSPLPSIQTVLRFGKGMASKDEERTLPVRLQALLTECGTLDLSLLSIQTDHRWKLEFQLRTSSGQERDLTRETTSLKDETYDLNHLEMAKTLLLQAFGEESGLRPEKTMNRLEEVLGIDRWDWPPSLLRALYDTALGQAKYRKRSPEHEARWWNFIGFALRPGYGYPLDDHRIKELWKVILSDRPCIKGEGAVQRWICYRRIAGGLSKGQQMQLAGDLSALLFVKKTGKEKANDYYYAEQMRAYASFELLPVDLKVKMGDLLVKKIQTKNALPCDFWALARLGSRQLLIGSVANVVPKEHCSRWIEMLLNLQSEDPDLWSFTLCHLARKSDLREVNLAEKLVAEVERRCTISTDARRLRELLHFSRELTQQEETRLFGEKLPAGLLLDQTV